MSKSQDDYQGTGQLFYLEIRPIGTYDERGRVCTITILYRRDPGETSVSSLFSCSKDLFFVTFVIFCTTKTGTGQLFKTGGGPKDMRATPGVAHSVIKEKILIQQ